MTRLLMPKKISPQDLLNLTTQNEHKQEKKGPLVPILALDYGEKFCGLAVAPDGYTVLPAAVVSTDKLNSALTSLVNDYKIEILVVGLPVSADGTENHLCAVIRRLVARLETLFSKLTICLVNERFSSQAVIALNKESRIDDLAAMHILEFYLGQTKS